MLFQTLVQLNILILATPALAGWSLLPPVHGTVRTACIVWQYRAAEIPVPTAVAAVTDTRQAKRHISVLPSLLVPLTAIPTAAPRVAFASLSILPHAARAP